VNHAPHSPLNISETVRGTAFVESTINNGLWGNQMVTGPMTSRE